MIKQEVVVKCDIAIFFASTENTGMVFPNVDLEDLQYAIQNYYSEPFYTLSDGKGYDTIINLAQVEYIRVKRKAGAKAVKGTRNEA